MKPIETVLLAVDFSDYSTPAAEYAVMLAETFKASLTVVHIINDPVDLRGFYVPQLAFDQLEKEIEAGAHAMMNRFCEKHLAGARTVKTVIASGLPYEEINRVAEEEKASFIVIGTHGRTGLDHLIFGSTAERVVRGAPCPVLTVRLAEKA